MGAAVKREEESLTRQELFQRRLKRHHDELRWLYMELYHNGDMFYELCERLYRFAMERDEQLVRLDGEREADPFWYRRNDMLGMMLYIDNFAGNLKGVSDKLDYLASCNVSCIHLMPFLKTPKGRSDGGYAVADFCSVQPQLGRMEELKKLAGECHKRGISLCMDFVMNHTSEDHEWAQRARRGEGEYMSRYFFFADRTIPEQYDRTVPQVFPTTAPGNFTWLPDIGHYVMTSFYPYQWDLNYKNPRVFNEMMYHFLFLVNQGMDIMRMDAVPYIWKEMGTQCRNLPQVHTIVRMMRMITEIVCPGVLLLGEVVMEPQKVVPYFGTEEKPECHMLYNVTTMATTWNSVAMRDIRLLRRQMDIVNRLPKEDLFLNYLRCHDDIGWGLDYDTLAGWGMKETEHKRFLNDYFTGRLQGSLSRGELYNDDPVTMDARFCGTTASMCGVESALEARDEEKLDASIRLVLMLHAYMFAQSGIPMLYSGDEIGQLNDRTYLDDADKREDSRYIHRGKFRWDLAEKRYESGTLQEQIFTGLTKLEKIRRTWDVFDARAAVCTYDVKDDAILGILRENDTGRFFGLFNFGEEERTAWIDEPGAYVDLLTGKELILRDVAIPGQGFLWAYTTRTRGE